MKNIEEKLKSKKSEIDALEVPAEMEERLRVALHKKDRKGSKKGLSKGSVAALLLVFMIISYSFDSLAYYGKKILGYDEVTFGSIKKLTEEGWGQKIGKSCSFSNGIDFILDGIMFDDNELIVFYKLKSNGKELGHISPFFKMNGIKPFGYTQRSGHGKIIDEYTQIWIQNFEPPAFYEKWMSLNVQINSNGIMLEQEIRFTLNRNAAMKKTAKTNFNTQVRIGQYDIEFETLSASGMSTQIAGKINPLTEEAAKVFRSEDAIKGLESPQLRFDIVTDNVKIIPSHAGSSASNNEISFTSQSEALPEKFESLELRNIRLERLKFIDRTVNIGSATSDLIVNEDLGIKKVEYDGEKTAVTILSRGIPVMGLFADKEQIKGEDDSTYEYEAESGTPVERVFRFNGGGENLSLSIKVIRFSEFSDKVVYVSLE